MNRIRNETLVPQGGSFIYLDPNSGKEFRHHTIPHLRLLVHNHRKANGYEMPVNWGETFIENVCAHTPGSVCENDTPLTIAQKAMNLVAAIADAARDGFKTRTAEEVEAIKAICRPCEYYAGEKGLLAVACRKCGCSKLKFHIASSHCPIQRW